MRYYISPPPMNPVSRVIAAILAALVLLGAFFFGLVVLLLVVGGLLVFGLVFGLRSWWLGRHPVATRVVKARVPGEGNVIDAEYTVVSRRSN